MMGGWEGKGDQGKGFLAGRVRVREAWTWTPGHCLPSWTLPQAVYIWKCSQARGPVQWGSRQSWKVPMSGLPVLGFCYLGNTHT